MRRQSPLPYAVIAAVFVLLAGCQPQEPFFWHNQDPTLSHYKGVATEIEYPRVATQSLADVKGAIEPFSVSNKKAKEEWNLKLEEVIQIALKNSKVIRSFGGQVTPQIPIDFILRNPDAVPSIYDPAIVESNPRTGVEAALSAFDTQFATNLFWQKVDTPQNSTGTLETQILHGDNAQFVAQLQKVNPTGGTTTIRHNVQYGLSNQLYRLYPSDWNVNLEVEAKQPLLRGGGVQYNRIAGPGAQPGQYNGVMLARLNTDIALADFEAAVRNLVSDTESTYWELYFYYRSLDAVNKGFKSALETWQRVNAMSGRGKGGEAYALYQAQEQYYLFRTTVEQTQAALYQEEARLRYLMGLAATDGRVIRPVDEPTSAKVSFDWYEILSESLVRNVELRRIKIGIQRREMELIASKNFLLPQLDLDALYRWRGLGNDLLSSSRTSGDFTTTGSNAYQSLTTGDYQEWQIGLQMQVPIGFRREHSGVRNAQLNLTKEHAVLQEAEQELSHTLATAWRDLEDDYEITNSNFQRRDAAGKNVAAVYEAYQNTEVGIDVLLQAQRLRAQAESDYFRSLVNYNRDIMMVHLRKGSLLEYNGVYLAEGPWPGKAYFDARRRARARDAAVYMDYGFTQPRVISEGPYRQFSSKEQTTEKTSPFVDEQTGNTQGSDPQDSSHPEAVPTPAPEPLEPGYNQREGQPNRAVPPPPVPADATTAMPTPGVKSAGSIFAREKQAVKIAPPTLAAEGQSAKAKSPTRKKSFDVSTLELSKLEDNPIQQTSATQPANEADSSAKGAIKTSGLQWTNSKQIRTHESNANTSAVESDRSASGWQGVQR